MNDYVLPLSKVDDSQKSLVGGKALAVAKMARFHIRVPTSLCITTKTFDTFFESNGLRDKVLMEYHRKKFADMRWEEIWDLSLRIKNMFLRTPIPDALLIGLKPFIHDIFSAVPVVVRSSAIDEDSKRFSFAGVHESYVNIQGIDSILKHIKLVWASLFSDAAILYRQQLNLDVQRSKMAVLVQQFINGQKSGVAFGKSPNSDSHLMIEAVCGLNQGLVDGTIEPDRWILSRSTGRIVSYSPAIKDKIITANKSGVALSEISDSLTNTPPLTPSDIHKVYALSHQVERLFKFAQDTEWTFLKRSLYCLQSRPITAPSCQDSDRKRQWYLSLKRGIENLKKLRHEIETTLIPEMKDTAKAMEQLNLFHLNNHRLAEELAVRNKTLEYWRDIYWDKFIPFAHGIRLFGEIYNKQIEPEDPYEFTQLLVATKMQSLERNRALANLAKIYAKMQKTSKKNSKRVKSIKDHFENMLEQFIENFRNPIWGLDSGIQNRKLIVKLLNQISDSNYKTANKSSRSVIKLEHDFIHSFPENKRKQALELLELARVSYQLRDDDNIYLGKIEGQFITALNESRKRLNKNFDDALENLNAEEAILALKNPSYKPVLQKLKESKRSSHKIKPRQLTGQPAGAGLATGKARVIRGPKDIFNFKRGEILVCDAIDPNMTFVVPIAAGVVERRGGMLIHGAIIAREYGLPCITGVPDAVDLIENGQIIIVDGYLGIVTIEQNDG